MKKWLGLILVLIVISSVLFYGYLKFYVKKISSLESITPGDVIYYVSGHNLNEKIEDFTSTPFFKQISDLSLYKEEIAPKLGKIKQKIPFLAEFFKKDVALAIYTLSDHDPLNKESLDIGDFLLLMRVDPKQLIEVKKSIADFYLSVLDETAVEHTKYKRINITTCRLSEIEMGINYALLSDVFIFRMLLLRDDPQRYPYLSTNAP